MQIQRQAKLPTALTFFFKLVTYPKAGSTLKYLYFLKEQNFIYSPVSIKGALRLDVWYKKKGIPLNRIYTLGNVILSTIIPKFSANIPNKAIG